MHGNTLTSSTGLKTRHFGTIISELTACLRIHAECGSTLNGVSLEFTGELADDGFSVTECLGGSMGLSEDQLPLRYQVCTSALTSMGLFSDRTFIYSRSATLGLTLNSPWVRIRTFITNSQIVLIEPLQTWPS